MYVQISDLANGRSGTYGWGANIAQQTSRITKMAITQNGPMNYKPLEMASGYPSPIGKVLRIKVLLFVF